MKHLELSWSCASLCVLAAVWLGCAHGTDTIGTSSSSSTGGGGEGTSLCPGASLCDGVCTKISFDPANCGACGHACGAGELCSLGQCSSGCSGGTEPCNGTCVDTQVDPENCGSCGHACGPGEVCSAMFCSSQCLGGTIDCDAKCVDTLIDPANCGACGEACEPDEVCSYGKCGTQCYGGTTLCGFGCADLQNDPMNCGACGHTCATDEVCAVGACGMVCLGGTSKCGTKCVDQQHDPMSCGACGHACQPGEACVNGACGFCVPPLTQCDAACVDLRNDPVNCGGCNVVCAASEVCSDSACAFGCSTGLTQCGQRCIEISQDLQNCGACGHACATGDTCQSGQCQSCDSVVTDCDGDGWMVADGDCCDEPGLCGLQPELVNPGAIEVVGNGVDDNCNGLTDLFDVEDTLSCDDALASNSHDPLDYAKAIGICRQTVAQPVLLQDKTWGLLDAQILRADGSPLQDFTAVSIRKSFGAVAPSTTEGESVVVMASGVASDGTQTNPGPNGGAPLGSNVSSNHAPYSTVDISSCADPKCIRDWFKTANPPLKAANALPEAPSCGGTGFSEPNVANDSVMLYLRLRAPTNAKAFSFNSYFLSAEYPEYVCSDFNDQFVALVNTPGGTPKPIPNPLDKNLMTHSQGGQLWPIGINIAAGTNLFAVCDPQAASPSCWQSTVSPLSCSMGSSQLTGTGFEVGGFFDVCTIGGGTFWLTTAGNLIPGDLLELRIAIWDVGDSAFDSLAIIDGFQWLTNATLPGTGG